ncbi:MAG: mechanosensitive ion channel [Candidatus Lokiarchaeota archaeon]
MKKIYQILIGLLVLSGVIWIYINLPLIFAFFNLNIDLIIVNVVIINIIAYIIRTILIRVNNFFFKGKFIRYILSIIINIIWAGFLFWLIFIIDPTKTLITAISSFLITAISLTFRDRINNIVSGILILTSNSFEVGDLIEIKGIQGIVSEISLNHTKIRGIDGLFRFIPNSNAYNAAVKKFSHFTTFEISSEGEKYENNETSGIKAYTKKFGKIISKDEKITRYIKIVQITSTQEPDIIDIKLNKVFKKYEDVFGNRPFYYINNTIMDRCSITLQIVTRRPQLILYHLNSFLRDILYELYDEKIFSGWDKEKIIKSISEEEKE